MKKYLVVLFALLFFSCSEILFDNPQPEDSNRLKTVPDDLWGFYKNGSDTLLISEYNFQFRSSLGIVNKIDFDLRNEDFLLLSRNNYYYLNIRKNEEEYSGWIVTRFSKDGKKLSFKFVEEIDKDIIFNQPINEIKDENDKTIAIILTKNAFEQYDKLLDSLEAKTFHKR